jgi:signal transduction histidine kinase/CheY-like chemotaxis protein
MHQKSSDWPPFDADMADSSLDALRPDGVLYQADIVPAAQRRAPPEADARLLMGLDGTDQDSWWHAIVPEDVDGARHEYARLAQAGQALDSEYRIRLPDGRERWLRDRARVVAHDAHGAPSKLVGVIDDVSSRNTLRQRVQTASDRYRMLFDSIDAGFCVIEVLFDEAGQGIDYRFLEVNTAFERVTGIHDGVGKRMLEIASDHEPHWFQTYGRIVSTGVAERFENSAAALGFHYDVYAFPVGDPGLRQLGVLFTDITQRKRAEDALREDGRRKTEFIAMLAHELRNPLATITSGLQAMKFGSNGVASHPATPMMERQIAQMTQLLDDLLDINRINLGKVKLRCEPADLGRLVREVAEAFQPYYQQRQLVLHCAVPPGAVRVQADATRLMQALGNLLSNAAKFSHAGGRVELALRCDRGQALIQVRDQGIGIEASQLERIFELFAQVDSDRRASLGSLGVGVALARELVEMHKGTIRAESAGPDQGCTFTITLPLAAQAVPAGADATPGPGAPADAACAILLIDDNRDAADSIGMVLELLGHEVAIRYSGADGLLAAEARRPDVVFTDIGMPGMDGHEVCRRLRARPDGQTLRIIALTGWGAQEDRALTTQAGFDHHLVKPVTTAKLREALASVMA